MKFQAKVMVLLGAILKYDVCVCGGCVIVRPPAGADWGMLSVLLVDCELLLDDCEPELLWLVCVFVGVAMFKVRWAGWEGANGVLDGCEEDEDGNDDDGNQKKPAGTDRNVQKAMEVTLQ